MAKIKVVINQPEPSKEVINRHKRNFENKLVKKSRSFYRIQGLRYWLYKDRLFLYFLVVIMAVLSYLVFNEN